MQIDVSAYWGTLASWGFHDSMIKVIGVFLDERDTIVAVRFYAISRRARRPYEPHDVVSLTVSDPLVMEQLETTTNKRAEIDEFAIILHGDADIFEIYDYEGGYLSNIVERYDLTDTGNMDLYDMELAINNHVRAIA